MVAYAHVPDGAQLVEHDEPISGLTISRVEGEDTSALYILAARMFADYLEMGTRDLPENPNSKLFETLHTGALQFNQDIIDNTVVEAIAEEVLASHRVTISKLREIAAGLGISYTEPDDPLLK